MKSDLSPRMLSALKRAAKSIDGSAHENRGTIQALVARGFATCSWKGRHWTVWWITDAGRRVVKSLAINDET